MGTLRFFRFFFPLFSFYVSSGRQTVMYCGFDRANITKKILGGEGGKGKHDNFYVPCTAYCGV